MASEFRITQLELKNFGERKISATYNFEGLIIYNDKEWFFQAMNLIFDPTYLNETVTNADGTRGGYVKLTYQLNGHEKTIKRMLDESARFYVDDEEADIQTVLRDQLFGVKEIYSSSPERITDHVMKHFFHRQRHLQKDLKSIAFNTDLYLKSHQQLTGDEVTRCIEAINHDLALQTQISELKLKWLHSKQCESINATEECLTQQKWTVNEFCKKFGLECFKSRSSNILNKLEAIRKRSVRNVVDNMPIYSSLGAIYFSATGDELEMDKKITNEHLNYYHQKSVENVQVDVLLKHKQLHFVTYDQWQNEKEAMKEKLRDEGMHFEMLREALTRATAEKEKCSQEIDEIGTQIEEMIEALEDEVTDVNFFNFLRGFVHQAVNIVEKFQSVLFETLNHPELKPFEDAVAAIFFRAFHDCPRLSFLFENVKNNDANIFCWLQSYIGSVSKVGFVSTPAHALRVAVSHQLQHTKESSETITIASFSGIEPQRPVSAVGGVRMKSVRTFVKRKPEFEALLSRFVMTKGENTSTKDCCVLNLSTKSMRLASGEEKMLLKSQNLFNVLNAVACIYNRIGLMVNERSADLFLKLRGELSKMYARENIESKIRSELRKLQTLQQNCYVLEHEIKQIECLMAKSECRRKTFLAYSSLQFEQNCDNAKFMEGVPTHATELIAVVINDEYIGDDPADNVNQLSQYAHKVEATQLRALATLQAPDMCRIPTVHDVTANLLKIANFNFKHAGYKHDKMLSYGGNFGSVRPQNDLSYDEIHREIDSKISKLQYPSACPTEIALINCKEVLQEYLCRMNRAKQVNDMCLKITQNYSGIAKSELNALSDGIAKALTFMLGKDCNVVCNTAGLHVTGGRVTFHPYVNGSLMERTDFPKKLFGILIYVVYAKLFTNQPILLHKLCENVTESETLQLCRMFLTVDPKCSILRVTEQFMAAYNVV